MSCKKFIDISPPYTSTNVENVYSSNSTAIAVLTGIYTNMYNAPIADGELSVYLGLTSDELTLYSTNTGQSQLDYYRNNLSASLTYYPDFWSSIYPFIYTTNNVIELLPQSTTIDSSVKKQLLGEAYFMRAYFYYYLTNLYGDLPLVVNTDYTNSSALPRSPSSKIIDQIVTDLLIAESNLNTDFLDKTLLNSTDQRVRPTKWAAAALLARAYMLKGDYTNAESQCSLLLENNGLFALETPAQTFLKNSSEAIWQLQSVNPGYNTQDAITFLLPSTGPNNGQNPVYLDSSLVKSFSYNDLRKKNWTDSVIVNTTTYFYPSKYKKGLDGTINTTDQMTEYPMMLRLGEIYLIRSEARARLNKISGSGSALDDLNMIRDRAGIATISSGMTQQQLLDLIQKENRIEMFTELGHRWLNIKRTETIDAIMSLATPKKGGIWQPYKKLFPVSQAQINANPALTQNTGY